jgi:hypothetical protein
MSEPIWTARAAPADGGQLPSVAWIVGTSCWLIPVLFTGGGFAWLGFLIIGLMLLRPTWLIAAGVYGIWAIAAITIADEQARIVTSALLTSVAIIHGLVANRRLLLTIWGRLERSEQWWGVGSLRRNAGGRPAVRAATRPRGGAVDVPREAEELLSAAGTSRSDYLADPEPVDVPLPPPRGRRRSGPRPTAAPAPTDELTVDEAAADSGDMTPVDVNTATVDEFRTLAGFTRKRAEAAVAARRGRTRFASVQEFADDLGLQPHELARLRDRLTCSRPRPSSFGRRVDL